MLLCVAGVATLAAIRWGLKDDGLICVATMVTARVLAETRQPQIRHRAIPPAECSG
jgi:hypothetical protein